MADEDDGYMSHEPIYMYFQVRATNNLCQMLLVDLQDDCFSDWSDAINIGVVDFEPTTSIIDGLSTTGTSSPYINDTDITETPSSCK